MWMGDFSSPSHEWIELYNTTDQPIDLSGWRLARQKSKQEVPMLTIPTGTVPALAYFLISNNGTKDCNLAVIPDLVDTSVTLTNTQLQIKLYDVAGRLIDTADDGVGKPMAGDNAQKKSMVRRLNDRSPIDGQLPLAWRTAEQQTGWKPGAKELGTPTNSRTNQQKPPIDLKPQLKGSIRFSELMWMGDFSNDRYQWIELYNTTNQAVDIQGWVIRSNTDTDLVRINQPSTIPPDDYFLIANTEQSDLEVIPDLIIPFHLPNIDLQLKLYAGQVLIDVADDGRGRPFAGNDVHKRSMVRRLEIEDGTKPEAWFTANAQTGWKTGSQSFGTPSGHASPVQILFFTAEASTQDVYLQWEISKLIEDWTINFNIYRNHQLSDSATYSQPIKINAGPIPVVSEIIRYQFKDLVSVQNQICRYQLEAVSRHPISQSERTIILHTIYLRQTPVSVKPKPRLATLWSHVKRLAH